MNSGHIKYWPDDCERRHRGIVANLVAKRATDCRLLSQLTCRRSTLFSLSPLPGGETGGTTAACALPATRACGAPATCVHETSQP